MAIPAELERGFERIGARVRVSGPHNTRWQQQVGPRIDVQRDRNGEIFDLSFPDGAEAHILNAEPKDRHLVLFVKYEAQKTKFLCGHDERHWFAAAIPETAPVGTVAQAKEALRPDAVKDATTGLRKREQNRRHNRAFVRQGEWFFVPTTIKVNEDAVLTDEPLTRGRGKPHVAQYLYRRGGRTVYVGRKWADTTTRVLTSAQFAALSEDDRKAVGWRSMRQDGEVFVKGTITHTDHATVLLREWCRVYPNTESAAKAMRQLMFLD